MELPALALNTNLIAQTSPLSYLRQGMADQNEANQRSLLKEVGGLAAQGDMAGAANAAYAGGDLKTGADIQNMGIERGMKMASFFADAAQRADTPEKWAKVIEMAGPIFGAEKVAQFADFNSGRPNALTVLQKSQLEIQQMQAQLAQQQAQRQAVEFAYKVPLMHSQALEARAQAEQRATQMAQDGAILKEMGVNVPAPSPLPPMPAFPGSQAPAQTAPVMAAPQAQPTGETPPAATLDASSENLFKRMNGDQRMRFMIAMRGKDNKTMQEILQEVATGKSKPPSLTEGQKALDKKYADDFAEFRLGGAADFEKNLEQLREVATQLKSGKSLTGPLTGMMPDWMGSSVNPDAVNTRQLVEEVVQRNLRIILGAQFTQKESEQLIARAYNPLLDEKYNAERVGRLIESMTKAYQAKKEAADYFEANGTLAGFKGTTNVSAQSIAADFEKSVPKAKQVKTIDEAMKLPPGTRFIDPNGVERVR